MKQDYVKVTMMPKAGKSLLLIALLLKIKLGD